MVGRRVWPSSGLGLSLFVSRSRHACVMSVRELAEVAHLHCGVRLVSKDGGSLLDDGQRVRRGLGAQEEARARADGDLHVGDVNLNAQIAISTLGPRRLVARRLQHRIHVRKLFLVIAVRRQVDMLDLVLLHGSLHMLYQMLRRLEYPGLRPPYLQKVGTSPVYRDKGRVTKRGGDKVGGAIVHALREAHIRPERRHALRP
mmetsp:Transcript_11821/g.23028  ORF Transcript_11821/g.23028 Transcript_11821/m.23028 type:complete len:201 (-) Transcript_11821:910-1512(-)